MAWGVSSFRVILLLASLLLLLMMVVYEADGGILGEKVRRPKPGYVRKRKEESREVAEKGRAAYAYAVAHPEKRRSAGEGGGGAHPEGEKWHGDEEKKEFLIKVTLGNFLIAANRVLQFIIYNDNAPDPVVQTQDIRRGRLAPPYQLAIDDTEYAAGAWSFFVYELDEQESPIRMASLEPFILQHISGSRLLIWLVRDHQFHHFITNLNCTVVYHHSTLPADDMWMPFHHHE